MSVVRLEKVSKSFDGKPILEDVDFRVEADDKIGLIGRNGTGKSTIFRLITGEMVPEAGIVERMRRLRLAQLAQLPDVPKETPMWDVVMTRFQDLIEMERRLREMEEKMSEGDESVFDEYATVQDEFSIRNGYEFRANAKRILTGLGFTDDEFDLPFSVLSGGQRTRLMLALVLVEDADLLLLDEPENHLDLQAREWLETFLQEWPRAFIIISHDRQMLNAVTKRTVEVERRELKGFTGNYDAYMKEKVRLVEEHERLYQKQQEQISREESRINRFRYKASKARAVQSWIKQLDKMEKLEAPEATMKTAKFNLGEVVRSGQMVMEARDLSMGYGDLTLYENVSFTVERGERVGIIGPNGAGKTTLLKHLMGKIEGLSGDIALGNKVKIGYYDQQHEQLNTSADMISDVRTVATGMNDEQIRSFMGRFLFTGEDVFKPIAALSGGERGRVSMAKLILSGANLILLDEPTNHLDIASREALEASLEGFPGTIVMVSHDRALIDKLANKLVIISRGKAEVHLGNYTHYRWKAQEDMVKGLDDGKETAMRIRNKNLSKVDDRKTNKADERERRKMEKRFKELETSIQEMEELVEGFEAKFAQVDPSNYTKMQALHDEYEGLKGDLAEMYKEWEGLAEVLAG